MLGFFPNTGISGINECDFEVHDYFMTFKITFIWYNIC